MSTANAQDKPVTSFYDCRGNDRGFADDGIAPRSPPGLPSCRGNLKRSRARDNASMRDITPTKS
jgi:hypothetical protein